MPPEGTPTDGAVSTSVCTVIPVALPAVAAPIAKPPRTMVRVVAGPTSIPAMVMTIEVAPGADAVAVMVATDAAPANIMGVADVAKNPFG